MQAPRKAKSSIDRVECCASCFVCSVIFGRVAAVWRAFSRALLGVEEAPIRPRIGFPQKVDQVHVGQSLAIDLQENHKINHRFSTGDL